MRKAIAGGLILVGAIFGQAPESRLQFDVATVRPAAPRGPDERTIVVRTGGPGSTDPERVRYRDIDLRNLLLESYGVPVDQLIIPDWVKTERYDITAKIPAGTTREQYAVMLRNLLVDRFKITSHSDKKDFTVYSLVVSKGGLKMKVSTAEPPPPPAPRGPTPADPAAAAAQFDQLFAQARGNAGGTDKDGFPALPENNIATQRTVGNNTGTRTNARGQTMAEITTIIQRGLGGGARVTDQTGLTGRYDFKLQYTRGVNAAAPVGAANPAAAVAEDPLPDLITAVQSQLGLKLEKSTAPFDVLVIDHIEKTPTDN
jgi:uncharacterized protein (TIGR03435 family)